MERDGAVSEPRRVFLTGATGFIGTALARRLARRGDRLRCLVRASSDTDALRELGAELVEADIADADALALALRDVDLAYHLAGLYDLGTVDRARMERTNVGGTAAFLGALADSDVPLGVYVSTTVALGPVAEGAGDERSEHDDVFRSAYERTKTEAHRLALEAQQAGVPLVIACPSNVYGPGDRGPNGRFLRDLLRGRIPGLLTRPAWLSFVHVDDVAEGLVLLGDAGIPGETYVLSGEAATVNDFAERASMLAGRHAPRLRFPPALARATAALLDPVLRLTGSDYSFNGENVATTAGLRWLHSSEKMRRELGWTARRLSEGLPETVKWYVERRRS